MFKAARWRSERNKIKAVFKLQFRATQVHGSGYGSMVVTLVPVDIGKPSLRSEKAAVVDGECRWLNPISETVRLVQDPKTGKINDKVYQFLVSANGSAKSGVLGEATINLADYLDILKPSSVSLPLHGSTTGAILHVTVQRIQSDVEGRETDENGDAKRQRRQTLKSQLSFPANGVHGSPNNINHNEEESFVNTEAQVKSHSSRNVLPHIDCGGNLEKSSSFDAISASSSESSSGQYTPKENGYKNSNAPQETRSLLSPLSNNDTLRNTDWSVSSAPDGSTFGSTNSSGESGLQEKSTESGSNLEKQKSDLVTLARQLEVSGLELQTLRKQVVKENKRGQDISKELSSIKEERDALKKELEELKGSKKKVSENDRISARLQFGTKDPWSMVEEMKEELDHEKNLNSNLRLQLQKTQESNSELIFAVRDLEALLEQKNGDTHEGTQEKECGNHGLQQESFETSSDLEEGQYELDVLVKEQNDVKPIYSQEQMIIDLTSELELYRKDREDLEMQMEQLALDYEILKQENHDISSRLEQIQLREQLRMQYECSAHLAIISELETHVESLEAELEKQAEVFEANLATVTHEKVELEKRAIEAEDVLRKTRWNNANTAEQLQEEIKRLSSQMSTAFYANEKLVLKTLAESRELHLQKSHLEDLLEKTNEKLTSVQQQHHVKCQQLLSLIDFKTKEADRLYLELKDAREELENQRKSEEARQKDSAKEMLMLKAAMERLSQEKICLSERIEQKEKMVAELEELKASTSETEMLLKERNLERETLVKQLSLMEEEASKSLEEHSSLRHLKDEKDNTIKILQSEVETLRAQYTDFKNSFPDDKLEKENAKLTVLDGTTNKKKRSGLAGHGSQEVATLNENSKSHEVNFLNGGSDMNEDEQGISTKFELLGRTHLKMHKVTAIGNECKSENRNIAKMNGNYMPDTSMADNAPVRQIYDFDGKQVESNFHSNLTKEGEILGSYNAAELVSEMANLREQNDSMAAELKEMQERYSEMSLKFAEVEGERQQLVITIRTLKHALKN